MAIKCGRCKQYHPTLKEVRECDAETLPERSKPPGELTVVPMVTERQIAFIEQLIDETATKRKELPIDLTQLSRSEASAVIDGLRKKPKLPPPDRSADPTKGMKPIIKGQAPEQGRFTVVRKDKDEVTIRFHMPKMGRFAGHVTIQYLYGPDNTSDYRRFGIMVKGGAFIFPNMRNAERLMDAVTYLLGATKEEQIKAGEIYALRSSNCWRCGRDLTREVSITRGMGPICTLLLMEHLMTEMGPTERGFATGTLRRRQHHGRGW